MPAALALVLGALAQLAAEVAHKLPERGGLAIAVRGPGRLGSTLEGLLAGQLRERGRLVDPPPGAADYRIECLATLGSGRVSVECRVRAVGGELWRAAAGAPAGDDIGRVFVQQAADADARELAGAPTAPLAAAQRPSSIKKVPLGDLEILALAAGDALGDGRTHLVGLGERDLLIWSVDVARGALTERRRIVMAQPPAPVVPRARLGVLLVAQPGQILARLADRAEGLGVRAGFPVGQLPDRSPLLATLALESGTFALSAPWPAHLHAVATAWVQTAPYEARWFGAAVDDSAQLLVYQGAPGNLLFAAAGAGDAVALYDADRDGQPEVATSAPTAPGDGDLILIRGARGELWRSPPITGAVTALAAGDFDGDGKPELVAAVRDRVARRTELWIVE